MSMSRMRMKRARAGIAATLALVCGAAFAHHSFSMFDMKTTKTLTGTVKQFEWTNPHTWLWMYVQNDKGETEQWGIEGMSPNFLGRRGWSKHTLKPGDKITVEIHPLRDGEKGGTFLSVTLPDGKVMRMFGVPTPQEARGEPAGNGDPAKN